MLALDQVGYRYPGSEAPALHEVSLRIAPGERVLIAGRSGSGKSTLLKLASGLLARHGGGRITGSVRLDGRDPATLSPRARGLMLGVVGQEPGDQLIAGSVADEVAFGAESVGRTPEEIDLLVPDLLSRVGLQVSPHRDPHALSGGQQQRLAVAAAMAGGGRLLLLDEPLARLDPPAAEALLAALTALAASGVAVVIAEHRLRRCMPWATRLVRLERGALVHDGPPEAIAPEASSDPVPREAPATPSVLELTEATVRYGARCGLDRVSVTVHRGEWLALVGPNGSGKSSLLGALSGRLLPPMRTGVIEVPQDPDLSLFSSTVRDELAYGPIERGLAAEEVAQRVETVARPLGLSSLLHRPPQGLSAGERLRVAVGAALTCAPEVLLLDEPTAGQDQASIDGLLEAIRIAVPNTAVVFATHDLGLARAHAHRALSLRSGRVVESGGAVEVARQVEPAAAESPDPAPAAWSLDPRARIVLLATVGVLSVILDSPLSLAGLAAITGAGLLALPIGAVWRWRALGLALALTWTTTLSQGLFYSEVPRVALVELGPLTLWTEGLWHGLAQSLRLLAAAFAGVAVAVSTPVDRLVAGLAGLRLPWSVGLLAAMALRFAPVVGREWAIVRQARAARGRSLFARTPWAWLSLESRLLRPVAARALRRARALALSLDARGFDPAGERSMWRPLRLGVHDRLVIGAAVTVAGGAVVLELLYRAYLAEVLYLPALRPMYGWVRTWL